MVWHFSPQCTMNIFSSKSGHLNNSKTVKNARFSSYSPNCCYISWFFRVLLLHIWHYLLWKIIIYCKKFGKWRKSTNYSTTKNGRFRNQKCSQCSSMHFFMNHQPKYENALAYNHAKMIIHSMKFNVTIRGPSQMTSAP